MKRYLLPGMQFKIKGCEQGRSCRLESICRRCQMMSPYKYETLSPAEKIKYLIDRMHENGMDDSAILKALQAELHPDFFRILLLNIIGESDMEVWDA